MGLPKEKMKKTLTYLSLSVLLVSGVNCAFSQSPVSLGQGSIASYPPTYKAKRIDNASGFNATEMLSRKLYVDEIASSGGGLLQAPGRALPTNDWWTDIINSRYSGALWSYPAMLSTSEEGLKISYPSYWADQGKEMKSRSSLNIGGYRFTPVATIAKDWHDADVVFRMPSKDNKSEMTVTAVHGMPFTWCEFKDIIPKIKFSQVPILFGETNEMAGVKIGDDIYGIYFPENASYSFSEGLLKFDRPIKWLVVGLLRSESELSGFAEYAVSIPRSTNVDWNYSESSSKITTEWHVEAENLRNIDSGAPVLWGFLPHTYKYMTPGGNLSFIDNNGYSTPRGKMKLAVSSSGYFSFSYIFSGMLPIFSAPNSDDGFDAEIMNHLISKYANEGSFGGDTYWGGKGLTQMAMNMWFAKLTGNEEVYETSRKKLKETFENWLTYTPGEDTFFFSYYPRWGAMLGFDVSYDSDSFNDHHFHYGYFTYAAALLCLDDKDFAEKYGEILTLIAKDYANWDKEDRRFPFMRTLDPWVGHSWAGGLGDNGNDNGNGQESSSEAMQAWAGIYLLGVALDNKDMRDAGIWGWSTEARGTREYWFDVDAPRNSNSGGRKNWNGKNTLQANYDYSEYPYAYNSNITGKGIGWWTWFGGDPLYMHGIQWMPISPALDYLSWDTDFVKWAYNDLMDGANSAFSHDWFESTTNSDDGSSIEPLAYNDWGNVVLCYMQRFDPKGAADIFDRAYSENLHIATAVSTGHISYYTIYSHLSHGDPDFTVHSDLPTAQAYKKDGIYTFAVYNPSLKDRKVNFYNEAGAKIKTVNAPARKLVSIKADPIASGIEYEIEGGEIIPPGSKVNISARIIDQYGAGMDDKTVNLSLSETTFASLNGNILSVNSTASKGKKFNLVLSNGNLKETVEITINDRPKGASAQIVGLPEICEKSLKLNPDFLVTDQYGTISKPHDTQWILTDSHNSSREVNVPLSIEKPGNYILSASSASLNSNVAENLFVTPSLPVVSQNASVIASSAENVGTLPENINDNDLNSRWGSAHTDNEWVLIDLGEDYFVSNISINWEAAFANVYDIQMAPDQCAFQTLNVNYAGETHSVKVPVETEWQTIVTETNSSSGIKVSVLNAKGRYVRMKGVRRSTQYGYSIYEMKVFGVPLSSEANTIIGVDFNLPSTMEREEMITLEPEAFTFGGEIIKDVKVNWVADKNSDFKGNQFIPLSYGRYTITAVLDNGITSESSIFVNDVEAPAYVLFENDSFSAILNEETFIPFTIMNQFLAPYTGGLGKLEISVRDQEGNETNDAVYDSDSQIFLAHRSGNYRIIVSGLGQCEINVKPLSEVNLALGQPASASSAHGGNTAAMAVDGNINSRWESDWSDNHSLTVELDANYMIDRINIIWEGAYAKKYSVSVSTDYENWKEVYSENHSQGNTDHIEFPETEARYVRLDCIERALENYGFSIWEFEIYGRSRIPEPEIDKPEQPGQEEPEPPGQEEPEQAGQEEPEANLEMVHQFDQEEWFTIQGLKISYPEKPGLYIIRKNGIVSKILIP